MIEQLVDVLARTWQTLAAMAPYLLFGFLMAGLLSILISPDTVERHLGRRGLGSALKAALLGVPLPLCSCGVIPVAASLRNHGASRGATTSFLISTPQTGVDSVFVTFSILGPVFAVFRPLVALVSGVLGGAVVDAVEDRAEADGESRPRCAAECCSVSVSTKRGRLRRVLRYGFVTLPGDIAKPLVAGIVIAGLLSALVPEDFFQDYFGAGGTAKELLSMFVMMLVGLPLYVCATASVPVAAAMIHMGVSPGAALVFLMTGPATNAAAVATIWKVMGRRTAITYLATVAVSAFAAGLVLNYIDPTAAFTGHAGHSMLPPWVGTASAGALVAVLLGAMLGPLLGRRKPLLLQSGREGGEHMVKLTISGMTCSHCAATIERALRGSAGVRDVKVDLKAGRAVIIAGAVGHDVDEAELRRRVEEAGYEVTGVESAGRQNHAPAGG